MRQQLLLCFLSLSYLVAFSRAFALLPSRDVVARPTDFTSALPVISATVTVSSGSILNSNNRNQHHDSRHAGIATRLFSAPAVLEPPTKEKEKVEDKEDIKEKENYWKKGGWAVRLFNDPMNKREFVAMCLSKIVGLSDGQAYQVMMQAHKNGVSVVGRFDFERAELYKTQLVENGLACDMIEVED